MQKPDGNNDQDRAFSSLINSLPLYIFAKDRDGLFIHANRAYCERLGLSIEGLIGRNDYEFHPPLLAEKYRQDDRRIMESGLSENIEEVWQTIAGEEIWVQVIKAPLRHKDDSEILGVVGVFWDITERKRAEIALAEERNLLRTLIDNLPDYVYVKDTKSRFLVANATVAQVMGAQKPDDLLGRTDHDFFPQEQADKFRNDELEVLESGEPVIGLEEVVTDHSGVERLVKTTKVPLKSLEDEVTGIIGIGYDITSLRDAEIEKARLEKQLQHAQKMETIGTLTAGIAHDFNNLLSVINGFTELMKLSTPPEHKHYETLNKVLKAGKGAAKLVGQLLAFSRKQVAQARVIDLGEEIEARTPLLSKRLGDKVELELHLADNMWPVRIDPDQLEQILLHLVENAHDAMREGGEVVFSTENVPQGSEYTKRFPSIACGEWVMLSIRDTGPGMTNEVQEHLFEPFFSTKEKHEGSGLGLATVFGIIKQNKGYIFVESEPGNGAQFMIFLPRSEAQVEEVSEEQGENSGASYRGEESILVVEDDPSVKTLACTILGSYGYTVMSAGNGAEAIMVVEQKGKEIDLLLTDVIMPGMNGKMVATEVTRRYPEMKIIYMSGYTDDAISKYGILEEGVEFIQKPFSAVGLAKRVRQVLDRRLAG